jgi:glycosyltransferase involved in cell wall biosynthesis
MQKPLISILTPFKNTSKFLNTCLSSIVNQSYTNWELLIIDDNSTDDSFKIVNAFAESDKRIKLLKNSGNGIIDALQLAFKASKGEYITRMDSDDIMHPEKLQLMHNDLQSHGKQHIALGLVHYFREEGIGYGFALYEKWLNELTSSGTNFNEIYKECVIPSPCWMIHRSDLIACGAFNPNTYPEDYDLAFRFYKQGYKCIPAHTVLHQWRDYDTRASRTQKQYAENHFTDLKLHYFLELNYDASRPLTIWGAGTKGKTIAKKLKAMHIPFIWVCDNPKKIGKHIYDLELFSFQHLKTLKQPQSIVSVANKTAQKDIKAYLKTQNMEAMVDYFFFC